MVQRRRFHRRLFLSAGLTSLAALGAGGAVAFAQTSEGGKRTLREGLKAESEQYIGRKLRAMVAKGEITREQAREKMEILEGGKSGGDDKMNLAGIERRVAAAVEAGKLTQKEADDRLAGYQRGLHKDKGSKAECGDWK